MMSNQKNPLKIKGLLCLKRRDVPGLQGGWVSSPFSTALGAVLSTESFSADCAAKYPSAWMIVTGEVVWLWCLVFLWFCFVRLFVLVIHLFIRESFVIEKRHFQVGAGGLQLGKTFTSEKMGFA